MRSVLFAVAVSFIISLPAGAKGPALTDEHREALAGQGLTRTELLNPDTLHRLSLGVDDNAKPQDRAWLKTDLSQVQADIELFDKLSKNPAAASREKDLAQKLDRMEKYLDPGRVAQLRNRILSGKAATKEKAPAEEEGEVKSASVEAGSGKGLHTADVPSPANGERSTTAAIEETEKDRAWWDYFYCKYYLQPLTGVPCD